MARQHREAEPEAVVESFRSYGKAQASLDALAEHGFPVESARIVARDLIFVERVVGRVTLGRAAADGAWSGAAVGALVGFFFGVFDWFSPVRSAFVLAFWGVVLGAIVGALIGAVGHWGFDGRRHYVRVGSLEAGRYDLMAAGGRAAEARTLLADPAGLTRRRPGESNASRSPASR